MTGRRATDPGPPAPSARLETDDWEAFLSEHLSRRVRVSYGSSRTNPLFARRPRRGALAHRAAGTAGAAGAAGSPSRAKDEGVDWHVRMHAMFAAAPPRIRAAVADLLRPGSGPRRARPVLEGWIEEMLATLPPRVVPDSKLATAGRCHDLARIARDLLATEMHADFDAERRTPRITWGRSGGRRSRRGMRLGSYDAELDLVRIHPALDQPSVPAWFVRYVLFHELLHAVHPPVKGADGRWVRHGTAFRRREKAYPDLSRALDWERKHIAALVRASRHGKPLTPARTREPLTVRFIQQWLFPDVDVSKAKARRAPRRRAPRAEARR